MSNVDVAAVARRLDEVKKEIAQKAGSDAEFRKGLLENPGATIEKEYGLPSGALSKLSIKVVEEPMNTVVVPIPPHKDNVELTDEQLEAVAGGAIAFSAAVVGSIAAGTISAGGAIAAGGVSRGW